ncbi:Protein CBG21098 [Caenorhabditis briggsae]|uniref:Protein CBG21098 n=1 Tax=Caenorhabditis briggsae TaxID=6238 RepID=A8XZH5_CAEBR|nr:Protein CBG21098 [Caenorhabditis briggsae]CAP38102.2 Protein CBG21098 [Caenorhabditis briggsae]
MLLRCVCLSVALVLAVQSFVVPVAQLDNCAAPNGTDKQMHWWQCNSGPVQFLNATPYDSTGTTLRNTVNLWKYGGWAGCTWSSIPTLGLLKDLSACDHGVPCPVRPGNQELDVVIDFTQFEQIISLLKDNQPYQLEYMLHDNTSGDDACMMVQAWAFLQ